MTGAHDIILDDLTDFDVQLRLNVEHQPIELVDVTSIVSLWMNAAFADCLKAGGWATDEYVKFERVILLERKNNRRYLRFLKDNEKCTQQITLCFVLCCSS